MPSILLPEKGKYTASRCPGKIEHSGCRQSMSLLQGSVLRPDLGAPMGLGNEACSVPLHMLQIATLSCIESMSAARP
jgi:hypothetical protein